MAKCFMTNIISFDSFIFISAEDKTVVELFCPTSSQITMQRLIINYKCSPNSSD